MKPKLPLFIRGSVYGDMAAHLARPGAYWAIDTHEYRGYPPEYTDVYELIYRWLSAPERTPEIHFHMFRDGTNENLGFRMQGVPCYSVIGLGSANMDGREYMLHQDHFFVQHASLTTHLRAWRGQTVIIELADDYTIRTRETLWDMED